MKRLGLSLLRWVSTTRVLAPIRKVFWRLVTYSLACDNLIVVSYQEPERIPALDLVRRIGADRGMTLGINEAYQIFSLVKRAAKLQGDLAEVGVFKGASAKLICEAKDEKVLHLFDTFEGLPQPGELDDKFVKGQYECSLADVRKYLDGYPSVYYYKGLFPDTAGPVRERQFAFVHLDLDLYESTASALRFFYPRMTLGGILVSHDYMWAAGVRAAFDEFFADKPEPVIELTGSQCMVVKCSSSTVNSPQTLLHSEELR